MAHACRATQHQTFAELSLVFGWSPFPGCSLVESNGWALKTHLVKMKACWWSLECWKRDFRLEKPISTSDSDIILTWLHSKPIRKATSPYPPPRLQLYNRTLTTRHAQMGPGKHTADADISTWPSTELPTSCQHQCTAMHKALPGNSVLFQSK